MALVLLLSLFAPGVLAQIVLDFNCTTYTTEFVYAPTATVCSNTYSDATCALLYPPETDGDVVEPATSIARPFNCYSADEGATVSADMKKAAVASCPKTCGYCCQTDAYSCSNVQFPRLNCATITSAQCLSSQWRTIIAQDCPSACGFCNEGGCVDGVIDCANDISICNAVGMQDFVNTYCQRTCARCSSASTTAASGGSGGSSSGCTSYIADSSTVCPSWAVNGFCTNTFYTLAQRKAYCATTCKLC
uniref:ShKT domain-containing protein n=1 Tax=Caenorhabditis japonica TaxID=281687 RepID=A0A8R1E2D3_CAEJA